MYKFFVIFLSLIFFSCSFSDLDECLGDVGQTTYQQIHLENFSKLNIGEGIETELVQSPEFKIEIEAGNQLKKHIEFYIHDDELYLKNNLSCAIGYTRSAKVKVFAPSLTKIHSISQYNLYSKQQLNYSSLYLSQGLANDEASCSIILNITCDNLYIETNNLTFFNISGQVNNLSVFFWGGNARIEALNLEANNIDITQRSSNHMYLNPTQSIKGTIYGNGNVYVKQFPDSINVVTLNSGALLKN